MKKKIAFLGLAAIMAVTVAAAGCGGPHEHELHYHRAAEATCSAEGCKEYYECVKCHKLYSDILCNTQVELEALKTEKGGHLYSGVYTTSATEHWYACIDCGEETEHKQHQFEEVEEVPATAVRDGHTAGTVCADCGYIQEGYAVLKRSTPFIQANYRGLNYCLYEGGPSTDKKPLVLFLHGAGERGTDNQSQLKNAISKVVYNGSESKFMDAAVLAPQCPIGRQWVDTPWADGNYTLESVQESATMKTVVQLVNYYVSAPDIDASRVYVVGLSMGAFGAWDLLARHGELFAAGVTICGGAPSDAIEAIKNTPVYTFHGTDDKTVPYEGTQEIAESLEAAGGDVTFVSFSGDGHSIWDKAITFAGNETAPSLEEWLFEKQLQAA